MKTGNDSRRRVLAERRWCVAIPFFSRDVADSKSYCRRYEPLHIIQRLISISLRVLGLLPG